MHIRCVNDVLCVFIAGNVVLHKSHKVSDELFFINDELTMIISTVIISFTLNDLVLVFTRTHLESFQHELNEY